MIMRKTISILFVGLMFGLTACNDWLDTRPENEQKEKDQFSTYTGFCDALTGCYMNMAGSKAYGERLTITNIESLANLWYLDSRSKRDQDLELSAHNYVSSYSEDAIQAIYGALFNTVVQANLIIHNIEKRGVQVILDPTKRNMIEGEAYAIRAYCQLDVLRLFGQVPGQANTSVSLPYSETTNINEVPAHYDFDAYVSKLEADLNKAEELLAKGDPIMHYTFAQLNSPAETKLDDFLYYRQMRLNYWAVKGLKARFYLYIGNKEKAYEAAKEVIDAKINDNPVMQMSGVSDLANGYTALPSECLFSLSKYNIMTNTESFLLGGNALAKYNVQNSLCITPDMLAQLYAGQNSSSNNRYYLQWNKSVDYSGRTMVATTKYYWNPSETQNLATKHQLIPMLRMSEIYLIAIETTPDLSEANSFYKEYMKQHAVSTVTDFVSTQEISDFILGEYRREFFAEGQMFYAYKRLNASSMLFGKTIINPQDYVLPLPKTEYNPNN